VDEALAVAEKAVALRPHRPENWRRLAEIADAAGDGERARQAQARMDDLRTREPSDR
jgi:Flp pilus assembly protein TadD